MAQATEIDNLVVRLGLNGKPYAAGLKTAAAQTVVATAQINRSFDVMATRAAASFKRIGASATAMGRTLSLRLTAPLLIVGGLGVRAFAKFDNAMIESTSIMKVTADQTDRMRKTALDLSREAVQGPEQLAEAYFFLASAGKNAEQSMALLPQVAKFATAGAFDMALATDLLTDAQSALGLSTKDVAQDTLNMARVSDVLVKANTLANASVQQFSIALTSKSGAALKAYSKDVEEGVAVLAALADQGIKAELAGNALDRVIRLSVKGALDNAEAHKRLGFAVFDEAGKMRNLGDIIGNLEQVLGGMSDKQRAAALSALGFEARVQGVILPLLGTSAAIKRYEKELRKAGGTTEDVANKQLKSFSNQMKIAWNNVKVFAIGIGEILAPMIAKVADFLKEATVWWDRLSGGVKKAIVVFGLIVAAIGPALLLFGGLTTVLGFAFTALSMLATVAGTVISFLAPIAIPIAAIAAAIGVLIATDFAGMWSAAKATMGRFFTAAKGFIANFQTNMGILFDWMQRMWARFSGFVMGIWNGIVAFVSGAVTAILNVAQQLIPGLDGLWDNVSNGANNAWTNALGFVRQFVSNALGFMNNFRENMGILWVWFSDNWLNVLADVLNGYIAFNLNMIHNAAVAFRILVRLQLLAGEQIIAAVRQVFTFEFLDIVLSALIVVGEKIREWGAAAWNTIKAIFDREPPSGGLEGFIDSAKELVGKGGEVAGEGFMEKAANIIKEESKKFKGPLEGFVSSIKDMPKFNLEVGGVDLPQFVLSQIEDVEKAIRDNPPQIDIPKPSDIPGLDDMPTLTIPVRFGLVSTTVVGSAEALAELEGIARQATRAARIPGGGGVPAGREPRMPVARPGDLPASLQDVNIGGQDVSNAIRELLGVNERTADATEALVADNEESVPLGIGGI